MSMSDDDIRIIINSALSDIAANVKTWNLEDINDLMRILYAYEQLRRAYPEKFKEIDHDIDAVRWELKEISEQKSHPWPKYWDEVQCGFAILCDNKGNFLGNPDDNPNRVGEYWVGKWVYGENCGVYSNETLEEWQNRLGYSQVEAANSLGCPVQTYRNWLHGRADVPGPVRVLCAYIAAFGDVRESHRWTKK